MAICSECTKAIQTICSQESHKEREKKANITLPRYVDSFFPGCWVCRKFAQWLETEDFEIFETWSRESIQVEFTLFGSIYARQPGQGRVLASLSIEILPPRYNREISGMGCEVGLDFATAQEFSKSQLTAPKNDNLTKIDFALVRTWFQNCTIHHEKCKKTVSTQWYPTRLLYLEHTTRKVKLVITENTALTGPYITLSHRWGPQSYEKLESSTLARLQNSIDLVSLPQVFQDAIEIAHFLDIKYLWIDALCIKQDRDDLSDWEVESKNMSKVYSCAILNVAATLSQDGSESLFKQESRGSTLPSKIEIEVDGLLQEYYVFDSNTWDDEIGNAPLNQRGWVFQERVLARRVLHFGQRQMGWECNELESLEIFPNGLPKPSSLSSASKFTTSKMIAATPYESSQPFDIKFVQQRQTLVHLYSKCKLTYSKDKLIAFDGIANSILATTSDRYVAGMWEYGLLYDLPWHRYTSGREAFPIVETLSRAPSWSWTSVDGEVNFPSLLGGVKTVFAEAQFSNAVLEGESAGRGTCSILAKGPIFTVDVKWLSEDEIASFEVMGHRFIAEDELSDSDMDIEIPIQETRELFQQKMVMLMPLFASAYFLSAILLTKIPGSSSFRRIGAVEIELVKEREEQNAQTAQPLLESSETEPDHNQKKSNKFVWNKAAVEFIDTIVRHQDFIQVIDIL